MTRSALRILNRARANAWRRAGIPTDWAAPQGTAPQSDTSTAPPIAPLATTTTTANPTGKNVAGSSNGNAGTSRSTNGTNDVPDSQNER